jgi:hypothetical protein
MSSLHRVLGTACLLGVAAGAAFAVKEPIPPERQVVALSPAEKKAALDFEARLKDYLALHKKLEATLPKLSKESTPQEVDKNQRSLLELMKAQRAGAKRGDLFSPGIEALVRRTIKAVLAGPDGKTIVASIMDENPGVPALKINDRYPDEVPLSTMPPQILEPLPKLEEDIEYRFIGKRLALLDSHAHMIIDFTNDVLP